MKKYKVVMLACDGGGDIVVNDEMTKEQAERLLKLREEKDWVHCYEIKEYEKEEK